MFDPKMLFPNLYLFIYFPNVFINYGYIIVTLFLVSYLISEIFFKK